MFFNKNNNKKKKTSQAPQKELKDRVNFTRIISIFFLAFFVYMIVAVFLLLSMERVYTFQDFVIIAFPLPCFLFALVYFINKDEMIEMDNQEVQRELDRVKDLHDARKRAEKEFDSN